MKTTLEGDAIPKALRHIFRVERSYRRHNFDDPKLITLSVVRVSPKLVHARENGEYGYVRQHDRDNVFFTQESALRAYAERVINDLKEAHSEVASCEKSHAWVTRKLAKYARKAT